LGATERRARGRAWAALGALVMAAYVELFGAAYTTLHWFMGMLPVAMCIRVSVAVVLAKDSAFPRRP
jgi:solute carrier family 45 protein 1/2/4